MISCFSFLLASSCFPSVFHFFLIFRVSWCYFSWIFLSIFFLGLLKKLPFFFFLESFKKYLWFNSLFFFFLLSINCSRTLFHAWSKKITFLCFQPLFWKNIVFLTLSLFLFKKKSPQKIPDSLDFFSLLFFWVCFLFLCRLFLFTHLVVTLLVFFFLLHASSPLVWSLHVYLLSLMFLLFVFIPIFRFFWISIIYFSFLLKNHSFLNWLSLFVKLFWFYRFFLFRPFSGGCFFFKKKKVFFRTRSNLPFFFESKNHLSNKSLLEFLFWFSVIGFFFWKKKEIYHHIPFQKNLNFLKFLENPFWFFFEKNEETCFTTKVAFETETFLSRSHFVVISSCSVKYSSLQLFQKKFVFIISSFFSFTINFRNNLFRKFVFWKKKSFFLSPLDFFCLKKVFSIFQLPFLNFCLRLLCFSFLLFSVRFHWWIHFSVCPIKKKKTFKNIFRENMGALNFFLWTFLGGREYIEQKKGVKQKLLFEFSSKNHLFWENLILYPRGLRIACAVEGFLDHCCVSRRRWRGRSSQVYVHSVVIDLGRATSVASSHLSPSLCVFFAQNRLHVKKIFPQTFFLWHFLLFTYRLFFTFLCFNCSSK